MAPKITSLQMPFFLLMTLASHVTVVVHAIVKLHWRREIPKQKEVGGFAL